ncbi:SMI1/KNR4 family protein [Chryseobacterium jejuense]|uniref:SMI1 / KNR4 family n=1 Tax=Chryseobacterium jejuense TaxID=445960 RepID=A0A2X2X962_CHRJE|nr:SMI1/KNR4 family protein [Chryseobacterium jejuense]SDI61543.1 SMI1-KNR4 cell-wall [Chryseobacterium jejuense]SQB47221.1 SMI1 / KNR4 family [Chryseobacterium jejuense]
MDNFILTEKKITNTELETFEQEIGLTLPESYKKHILKYNGGTPEEKDCFDEKVIAHFYPIKYGKYPLEKSYKTLKDSLPQDFLNFAYDEGGNPFCLNLKSGKDYGKVYFCALDEGDVEAELLADSFKEFMDGLEEDPDF